MRFRSSPVAAPGSAHRFAPRPCAAAFAAALGCAWLAATPLPALAEAAAERRTVAVPAGKLSDVLAQFAAAVGAPLSFDPRPLAALHSPGLQGAYGVREGFERLLAGSGYRLVELGGAFTLEPLPTPAAKPVMLGPITVNPTLYGAKETNSLGDSSASVGVVTAAAIADSGLRSFRDAFRRLGNVADGDWVDAGFIIRGVSSEGFVPGGAPVGSLYVDGVLQTPNAARRGARGLWDVEQVEVYRGPQSTFSGRAAMSGAIYIKTKDPVFAAETTIAATAGSDDLAGTAFLVNRVLLDDQLAVRLSGEVERSKSDLHYPSYSHFDRSDDLETDLYYNLRGKALWLPAGAPDTSVLVNYAFADDSPNSRDIGSGPGFSLKAERGDFNAPTYAEVRATRVHNLGVEVTHGFSEALRFTALTGLHRSSTERPSVNQGSAGEINVIRGGQRDDLFTQELRLNYDAGRLQWVAGFFGSFERYDTTFHRTLAATRYDRQLLERDTTNVALFGEVTYEFLPSWRATLGGRLDYSQQESQQRNFRTQPLTAAPVVTADYDNSIDEFNAVPKLGLARDFGDHHSAGLTYSRGFRAGGYGLNSGTGLVYEYDPEDAENIELYYKGRSADQRLGLNVNVFHTRYHDQQVEMRLDPADPFSRETTNAASSRAIGFEIEPTLQLSERLSAFASIGYVDSEFEDFDHANYGDLSGKPFPEAPKWTVSLGGTYRFDRGYFIGADAKRSSGYAARFGTPPQDQLDGYTIVNLQAGYRGPRWELTAFAENLFDKRYYTYLDSAGGYDYATLGAPRRLGVNARLNF